MFKENNFKLMYILRSIVLVLFILTALGSCEDDAVPKVKKAIPAAEETADEGTSTEETADEGTSTEETADEGTSTEETADEGTSTEETADEGTSTEETADEGTSTEETADEGTSTEETADEGTSTEETADEGTSKEETADEGTPKEETADEGTPKEETADEGTPKEETADEGTPKEETADESTSTEETADEGTATEETADEGTPKEETADESTPKEETADESTSKEETGDESTSKEETGDAGTEYAGLAKLASDKLVEAKVAQAAIEGPKQTAVDAKRSAEDAARGLESNPKPPVGQFRGVVGAWNAAKGLADVYVAKAVTFKRIADEAVGAANAAEVVAGTANQAAALQAQLGAMELQTMAGGTKEAADRWLRDVKAALADANAKLEAAQAPPQPAPQPAPQPEIPVIPSTGLQLPLDTLPVFLVAGQSNALGQYKKIGLRNFIASLDTAELRKYKAAQNQVYFLNGRKKWASGLKPIDTTSNLIEGHQYLSAKTRAGMGPEVSFAYHMQKRLNRPIGIVKYAMGGSSIHFEWSLTRIQDRRDNPTPRGRPRNQTGWAYRDLKNVLLSVVGKTFSSASFHGGTTPTALQSIKAIKIIGILWIQGEHDQISAYRANKYADNLKKLIPAFRTDVGNADAYFTAVQCRSYGGQEGNFTPERAKTPAGIATMLNVNTVISAIKNHNDPKGRYDSVDIDGINVSNNDGVHYDAPGYIEVGKRLYNKMIALMELKNEFITE